MIESVNKNTMWITGNIRDFENRLHQLPTGTQDLITGFVPEGLNYTGNSPLYQNLKWNKELNLQYYRFSNDATMLATGRWFY